MIGIVISIKSGMIAVDVDGVIYNTAATRSLRWSHKIKVGDKVVLDSQTFQIIEIL